VTPTGRALRTEVWPALPYAEWRDTLATLQRWTQMVGKTRLALSPFENHYWHVALYVTSRGLTTSPMPLGDRTLEIELDFLEHVLIASTSDGRAVPLALEPQSVASFYARYRAVLAELGATVRMYPRPSELADATPFPEDRAHAKYDADAAQRCWRILTHVDQALKAFRGRFVGKSSPSHFWWGSFDIACTRFSGRGAPVHPGGFPGLPDRVTRESYSRECISAGWWPGSEGGIEEPGFYAYAYPVPGGCADVAIRPAAASWNAAMGEWILPYDIVRNADDPHGMVLEFFQSTYEAAANLAGWPRAELERPPA
jgi:hypothetical protein